MDLAIGLLLLSACNLMYFGYGFFVYVNDNLTFSEAWTRCHNEYEGHLAVFEKWKNSQQKLKSSCFETNELFWHGSLIKSFPWISFEGCYSYRHHSKVTTMPYKSLAWCQNQCRPSGHSGSFFAVDGKRCLCDIDTRYLHLVDIKQCSIPCDDSAMCGGNGYISLYRRVTWMVDVYDFDSPEVMDKQCLVYNCVSQNNVTMEAVKCTDHLLYICENRTGLFHSREREPWLTSNILCPRMLRTPTCRYFTMFSDLRRWTKIFRVQDQFKDDVSMTMKDVRRFLNTNEYRSSFFTDGMDGRRILFPDGQKEYLSLCETDIPAELLIDGDRICVINSIGYSSDEVDKTTKTPLGFEYSVVIGPIISVLLTVGFVIVFHRVKNRRQQRLMDIIEMQMMTPQLGEMTSGVSLAESESGYLEAITIDMGNISRTNNPPGNCFARKADADGQDFGAADGSFIHSKGGNDDQNDASKNDIETDIDIYNELEDICV